MCPKSHDKLHKCERSLGHREVLEVTSTQLNSTHSVPAPFAKLLGSCDELYGSELIELFGVEIGARGLLWW